MNEASKGPFTLSASHTSLIQYNRVAPKYVATPFWSNSIIFDQRSVPSVMAGFMMTLSVNIQADGSVNSAVNVGDTDSNREIAETIKY